MKSSASKSGVGYLILALATAACGGDTEQGGPAEEEEAAETGAAEASPAAAEGYTVVEVTDGGSLRGTVRFTGTVPAPRSITISEDAETCGATQQVQTLEVGAGQGLANAVVSLTDITGGAALEAPASPPTLDQRGCRFTPHVLLARAGDAVHVLNNDALTHNVHTASFDNRPVNRSQPQRLREIEVTFDVPEKVHVKCDIHGWMSAWIVVIDHPYNAVTDQAGSFVIENVPPGTYTLEIWHETLGASTQSVTVTASQTTTVSVELADQG